MQQLDPKPLVCLSVICMVTLACVQGPITACACSGQILGQLLQIHGPVGPCRPYTYLLLLP